MEAFFFGSADCLGKTIYYYLLQSGVCHPHYGIKVLFGDENVVIPKISTRKESVCALLEQMLQGAVTPVTVSDVIEDWLGE